MKSEEVFADAERAHAGDPERVELICRARRFKTSWIELAEALSSVRQNAQWKRWGHASFEDYAKNELHLRQETVEKLTASYGFLKNNAPKILERDSMDAPVPTYQAVDFLRRVEAQESAPQDVVREIRKKVLEDGVPLPTVSKEYKDVIFPVKEEDRFERDKVALKNVASRLRSLLDETKVLPADLSSELLSVLGRILELVATEKEKKRASAKDEKAKQAA
jgi:hypothetical protein